MARIYVDSETAEFVTLLKSFIQEEESRSGFTAKRDKFIKLFNTLIPSSKTYRGARTALEAKYRQLNLQGGSFTSISLLKFMLNRMEATERARKVGATTRKGHFMRATNESINRIGYYNKLSSLLPSKVKDTGTIDG